MWSELRRRKAGAQFVITNARHEMQFPLYYIQFEIK